MKPLGICRTAFYVSKKIMCAVLIVFSLRGRAQSSVMMEKETCSSIFACGFTKDTGRCRASRHKRGLYRFDICA